MEKPQKSMDYRFVRMGYKAPGKLSANEIWIDVGGRFDGEVIDHHGQESQYESATEMLAACADDLIRRFQDIDQLVVTTHERPDLDAIGGVWLLIKIHQQGAEFAAQKAVKTLIRAISDNDQGYCLEQVEAWWPLIFRLRLESELRNGERDDSNRLLVGFRLLDQTLDLLQKGKSLAAIAESLIDSSTRKYLLRARADYDQDLQHALPFQLELPVDEEKLLDPDSEREGPPRTTLVDALYLPNPRCQLVRELARTDGKNRFLGHGFHLLITGSQQHGIPPEKMLPKRSPWRFIISVDPLAGVHMRGLGFLLEQAEQERDRTKKGLRQYNHPIRERQFLGKGKGRHNLGVESPWYDGRGHSYTIIDSPSFDYQKRNYCGSSLTPGEVLEIVWKFGIPARFVPVRDPSITFFVPVNPKGERPARYDQPTLFFAEGKPSSRFPIDLAAEMMPTVQQILQLDSDDEPLWGWETREISPWLVPDDHKDEVTCRWQEIWEFKEQAVIWAVTFTPNFPVSLFAWMGIVADLNRHIKTALRNEIFVEAEGMIPDADLMLFLTFCRSDSRDISFARNQPFVLGSVYQLAEASSPVFAEMPNQAELDRMITISSHDSLFQACFTQHGIACISLYPSGDADEEALFFRPLFLKMMTLCALAQRFCIDALLVQFTEHKYRIRPLRGIQHVLQDRLSLLALEQSILFDKMTDHYFGQSFFTQLQKRLQVGSTLSLAREQIETLAEQVREHRDQFVNRVLFWLTVVFGPFSLVTALFSGIHMDREFGLKYHDPLRKVLERALGIRLEEWIPSVYLGWASIVSYLVLWVLLVVIVWSLLRVKYRDIDLAWATRKWLNPRTWWNAIWQREKK